MDARRLLITDPAAAPGPLIDLARILGFRVQPLEEWECDAPEAATGGLIVLSGARRALAYEQMREILWQLEHGAVVYIGLSSECHEICEIWELIDGPMRVAPAAALTSYRARKSQLVARLLEGESDDVSFASAWFEQVPCGFELLFTGRRCTGAEVPLVIGRKFGAGALILDATTATGRSRVALLELARPEVRVQSLGALAAAHLALEKAGWKGPPICLTIDDRPANFDYFNVCALRRFLGRTRSALPNVHIDFAWTPDQRRPSNRYVAVLKDFGAGFVWHGFYRHVDHRLIADLDAEMSRGRDAVRTIEQRHGVNFQPVMIFPFERNGPEADQALAKSNFLAKVQSVDNHVRRLPCPERVSAEFNGNGVSRTLLLLRRASAPVFDRDTMLATCLLAKPLIASGHPYEVGLDRLCAVRGGGREESFFEGVLDFARSKALRSASLAEISIEQGL